jgi:hypothetical protein
MKAVALMREMILGRGMTKIGFVTQCIIHKGNQLAKEA